MSTITTGELPQIEIDDRGIEHIQYDNIDWIRNKKAHPSSQYSRYFIAPKGGVTRALHRYTWVKNYGPVPKGLFVHHKIDPDHNDIGDLELLTPKGHSAFHAPINARMHKHTAVCEVCGKRFRYTGVHKTVTRKYCSDECRQNSHFPLVEKICGCGNKFMTHRGVMCDECVSKKSGVTLSEAMKKLWKTPKWRKKHTKRMLAMWKNRREHEITCERCGTKVMTRTQRPRMFCGECVVINKREYARNAYYTNKEAHNG